MLTLILKEGGEPQTLQLSQDVITFGRSKENVVVIRNIKASRHHAKIERIGGTYQVTDLGSGNGTKVNGEKVDFQALKAGDEIRIGDATLTLKSIDDAVDGEDSPSELPTEEINLETSDDLKIEGEEIKLEGEEAVEGEEVELEADKIEIQDDSDDLPSDERETEISIKPAPTPAKPASRTAAPPPKPVAAAKPPPAPAKPAPAPAKPADGKPGLLKRPTLDRFKKKP